jgi:hypothetical protein
MAIKIELSEDENELLILFNKKQKLYADLSEFEECKKRATKTLAKIKNQVVLAQKSRELISAQLEIICSENSFDYENTMDRIGNIWIETDDDELAQLDANYEIRL